MPQQPFPPGRHDVLGSLGSEGAALLRAMAEAVGLPEASLAQAEAAGQGELASVFPVTDRAWAAHPQGRAVALDAYGWTGPWRTRRGFDSLVQMSVGIAEAGMRLLGRDVPTPLPVQALDHATGYLLAAAVVRGLIRRVDDGRGSSARASLARTAALLTGAGPRLREAAPLREERPGDYGAELERTPWGPARRLRPPYALEGTPAFWTLPAGQLGDGEATWEQDQGGHSL